MREPRPVPVPRPLTGHPPEVMAACHQLIAYAMNTNSEVLNLTLTNNQANGQPLPDFEISIRRI